MIRIIILCSILAILVFSIQFALCFKVSKKAVRLIPIYIIIALYVLSLLLCLIDFLDGKGGVAMGSIFAFIIIIPNTVALAADVIAWVVYWQIQKNKNAAH